MATQAQIDANRRNAQQSTGPKTPEGRAAVRHNALKHGLTAEILIHSTDEQPEFDRLCEAFETEYRPVGPTEESLLENLVAAKWRLSRARKAETGFFMKRGLELNETSQNYRDLPANGRLAMIVDSDSACDDTLSKISRYECRLERSFYNALSELRRAQSSGTRSSLFEQALQSSTIEEAPQAEVHCTQTQQNPVESPGAKQTQSEAPEASETAPQPHPPEIPTPLTGGNTPHEIPVLQNEPSNQNLTPLIAISDPSKISTEPTASADPVGQTTCLAADSSGLQTLPHLIGVSGPSLGRSPQELLDGDCVSVD